MSVSIKPGGHKIWDAFVLYDLLFCQNIRTNINGNEITMVIPYLFIHSPVIVR